MNDLVVHPRIGPTLTADQARALTDQIKAGVADLLPLIKQAFEGRADLALGYTSWPDYCEAELSGLRVPINQHQRREAVADLRQTGMSTRAIGSALGASEATVRRDIQATASNDAVDKVISLDGRERPAAMPKGQEVADQIVAGIDQATKTAGPAGASATEPPAAPSPPSAGGSTPDDRPKPPKWDPAERKAHEEEVARIRDIEAARRAAKTIVTTVRSEVVTIVTGCRYGEPSLVTRDMIAELRSAIDLLETEVDESDVDEGEAAA